MKEVIKILEIERKKIENKFEIDSADLKKMAEIDQALQLQQTGVVWQSEQFYCNQDDGEYNNNPCSKQCNFCKEAESFK